MIRPVGTILLIAGVLFLLVYAGLIGDRRHYVGDFILGMFLGAIGVGLLLETKKSAPASTQSSASSTQAPAPSSDKSSYYHKKVEVTTENPDKKEVKKSEVEKTEEEVEKNE